jgi:hypothetical protein
VAGLTYFWVSAGTWEDGWRLFERRSRSRSARGSPGATRGGRRGRAAVRRGAGRPARGGAGARRRAPPSRCSRGG